MSIPLLGQQPAGVCITCKGRLTPDHEHVYIDKAERDYTNMALEVMLKIGCLAIVPSEGFVPLHPPLPEGFMWFPVEITHLSHPECRFDGIAHHHCEVQQDDAGTGQSDEDMPA